MHNYLQQLQNVLVIDLKTPSHALTSTAVETWTIHTWFAQNHQLLVFSRSNNTQEFSSAAAVDVGGGTHSTRHSLHTQMQQKHEGTESMAANTSPKRVPTGAAGEDLLPTELSRHLSSSICTVTQERREKPAPLSSSFAIRFNCAINQNTQQHF